MASRKDYDSVALALRGARNWENDVHPDVTFALDMATRNIADAFARDNAAFSYSRFYEVAGMGERR